MKPRICPCKGKYTSCKAGVLEPGRGELEIYFSCSPFDRFSVSLTPILSPK